MSTTATSMLPDGYFTWEDLKAEVDAERTPEQRLEYETAGPEAEAQIELTEIVYRMRTQAGISQTELARRMGVRQPFIAELERGGRNTTLASLHHVAHTTGHRVRLAVEPLRT